MNIIHNNLKIVSKRKNIYSQIWRYIFVSPALRLKEIRTVEDGKNITVSATIIESERKPFLINNKISHVCSLCATGLDVKHTDVLILSQFLRQDGCMLPRRITNLCNKQQKRVSSLVTMAQKAGLMPNLNPTNSKRDPKQRFQWKKFNKYFDESTIKWK